jgi:hypothetical protein
MHLPEATKPEDTIGPMTVPESVFEQADALVKIINDVLRTHSGKIPVVSVCTGSCGKEAVKKVKAHYEAAGWKVKVIFDSGERLLQFSRY